jgi:phosphoglycerol transferase MdoB-like AlkP superfamily enzyme
VFYLTNVGNFPNADISLFFYGVRFDLSAIFYTNAPYILTVLLPFSFYYKKNYQITCNIYFILVNSFAALVSYIDVAYFPYVLKRMTADIFSYLQIGFDFQKLLPSFLRQFWYLLLLFFATVGAIVFVVKITSPNPSKGGKHSLPFGEGWSGVLSKIFILCAFIALSIICMRGGFQLRPITLIDTAKRTSIQNAALVSNTPFSLIHTFGKQYNIEKHYFKDLEDAEQYFSPIIHQIIPFEDSYPVKNVIIIVLESFSQYIINGMDSNCQGFTPFLDSLQRQSISFNGIANGRRTIESLPAIFGGIPALLDMSYVESSFAGNYTYSPVEILKDKGYKAVFFHGAKNGSMNIESYCYSVGFENYYGKNEYPNSSDYDGIWGISDRSYLKYVSQQLNTISQPFFAGILTLSSHNPYILPKDAKGLDIKEGTHPMHALASYTDHAIREFFKEISKYTWFDSTLFIFTSDHTGEGAVLIADNRYMAYQIPIFFYHPQAKNGKINAMMQQTDIMPTLFSYLNINTPLFSYGNNAFDSIYIPFAINYLSGIYQFFTNDFLLQFDGEKTIGFYNIKSDILLQNNLNNIPLAELAIYEQKLKAIIQSYTTRMTNNQLFIGNDKN